MWAIVKISCFKIVVAHIVFLLSGCSVISPEVRKEALPALSLSEMIENVDEYKGRTVILGGYVISVENHKNESFIVAVQTPLGVGQQPKPKDQSEGRLILHVKGFIDPEVYTKDSRITLGGEIVNSSRNDAEASYPYLRVEVREIHLWPAEIPLPPDYYWYDRWYPFYPIRLYRR